MFEEIKGRLAAVEAKDRLLFRVSCFVVQVSYFVIRPGGLALVWPEGRSGTETRDLVKHVSLESTLVTGSTGRRSSRRPEGWPDLNACM